MLKRRTTVLLALLLALLIPATAAAEDELSAQQIIDKALDQNGLGFYAGQARLELTVDKNGTTEKKEMIVKSKREGEGDDEVARSNVKLVAPAEVAGEAYLFLGNPEREDDVYIFLPAFKETRRISGQDKTGSFLGSHLTFRDLESRDMESGTQKRLPDESIGPHKVYVIESTPDADEDTDYGKVVSYIRQKDFMPLRVEFFDKNGTRVKRIFSEKISRQDDVTYVKKMSVFPEDGGSTVIDIVEVDFDAEIPDRVFSKDALGQ